PGNPRGAAGLKDQPHLFDEASRGQGLIMASHGARLYQTVHSINTERTDAPYREDVRGAPAPVFWPAPLFGPLLGPTPILTAPAACSIANGDGHRPAEERS